MRTDLSKYDNSWYNPGGGWIVRFLWFVLGRLFVNTYIPFPMTLKRFVLRLFRAKIGKGVVIKPKVNIKYPWFLTIGDYSWIGEGVWIDNLTYVEIQDNCCLSQGAMLLTGNHNYKRETFDLVVRSIKICSGAWVGAQVVVCPGVVVGSHSVITVGSMLLSSSEADYIYQGNPAVKLRERVIR